MRISDWSSDVCSSDLLDGTLHVGRDGAGAEADDVDTSVAVFLVDAARQHQHRGLGGAVVTPAFKGAGGGTGADVHDHAVPLRLHDRDRRAQAVVDALQVDVHASIPPVGNGLPDMPHGGQDGGFVPPN